MPASNVFPPPRPTTQADGDVRPASETDTISPVNVAREAYARYEARGREDGHDVEDWLAAEEHLRQSGARFRAEARRQNDAGEEEVEE